jgi:hypothetical protein
MHPMVEINSEGILHLPDEILQTLQPHTRFSVAVENGRVILSPVPSEQPFWATATPKERVERWHQWVQSHKDSPNLPDEALRRENIYD